MVSIPADFRESHYRNTIPEALSDQLRRAPENTGIPASIAGSRLEVCGENATGGRTDEAGEILSVDSSPPPPPLNHSHGRPTAKKNGLGKVGHLKHGRLADGWARRHPVVQS